MDTEIIHKELDLIQDVVKRMAANSFVVKAWLVGVLGAMITLSKDSLFVSCGCCCHKTQALLISFSLLLPVLCFWFLDAFFLKQERLFREVYKWAVKYRSQTNDYLYDLNTYVRTVGTNTEDLRKPDNTIPKIMRSDTIMWFYAVPLVLIGVIILYNILR